MVPVTGLGGVPATGVSAVVVNITVVSPSTDTYLAAYPGTTLPEVSNINAGPGQIRTNLATVTISSSGQITLYNAAGDTDAIIDVMGYFSSAIGNPGGRFRTMSPTRMLDTRITGNPPGPNGLVHPRVNYTRVMWGDVQSEANRSD